MNEPVTASGPAAGCEARDAPSFRDAAPPVYGDVIGAVTVPPTPNRHDFAGLATPLAGAAGVRDLHVVFEDERLAVSAPESRP
ncbi:hypothetical protein [Planotetraspora kaengkrachanensis]|uniref:Uncharacterized protein n=1 Tax=Planotetraspora kaengkrachanensis TaxID=575193 RepID=A0A8J3M764_9ACTN|nr:hypothetical protein [Planotetraspora kaengkrachanensis]GIG80661.1 hypothetical protein Pka01_37880 [Planotetraspora kaengkrachanensis]